MRPWRSGWTNLVVLATMILLAFAVFPRWLCLAVAIAAVKYDKWFHYLRETRKAEEPVADSDFAARAEQACQRVGLPHLQVVTVRGNGGPYLTVRGNQLLIAAEAVERLTEAELDAAILHSAVTPPSQRWRLEVEAHLPWGAVTMLVALLGLWVPLVGVLFIPALLVWAWSQGQNRPYCPWLTREHFQAFLGQGGDGLSLIAAHAKINWFIAGTLPQGSIQDRYAARAWANLRLMAEMCGMAERDLLVLADSLGLEDLYGAAEMSTWHRMGFARAFFWCAAALALLVPIALMAAWSAGNYLGQWINQRGM
ncbi:MAG TPA: hypothetical protein VNT01_02040 [Symbiobacteriaceae bacterium]|nr:hypothetical protein [Symbiobacteriaceae bacterium]